MKDRVHWHVAAPREPELTSDMPPYCKTKAFAQLWVVSDWSKASCAKCLRMKSVGDKLLRPKSILEVRK